MACTISGNCKDRKDGLVGVGIPLLLLILLVVMGSTAINEYDIDSLLGISFICLCGAVFYMVKFKSRLNAGGWILSAFVIVLGMALMVQGLSVDTHDPGRVFHQPG